MQPFAATLVFCAVITTLTTNYARASDESVSFQHHCRAESAVFKTSDGGCKHIASGLVWGMRALQPMKHADAEAYCEKLVDGRWSDWRLPKFEEIDALAKEGTAFGAFRFSLTDMFWTHDNSSSPGATAMSLMSAGDEAYKDKNDPSATVCVRQASTKTYGCRLDDERFTTAHGGCQQLATGVVWSRPAPIAMDLIHAANYCYSLDVEGDRGQWSLPTLDQADRASGELEAGGHLFLPTLINAANGSDPFVWTDRDSSESELDGQACNLFSGRLGQIIPEYRFGVICVKKAD